MSCGACGKFDLSATLGKCSYCIWLAVVSSAGFWGLGYFCYAALRVQLLAGIFFFFAFMTTSLLIAHVLAFLSRKIKE